MIEKLYFNLKMWFFDVNKKKHAKVCKFLKTNLLKAPCSKRVY